MYFGTYFTSLHEIWQLFSFPLILWYMIKYRLLEKDPFHLKCTLVHLAAAMELGHSNELYLMACNLVKDYPQKWVGRAWVLKNILLHIRSQGITIAWRFSFLNKPKVWKILINQEKCDSTHSLLLGVEFFSRSIELRVIIHAKISFLADI